jgi:ZIP family zinc transporter
MSNVQMAFILTLIAGLATGIGSFIAFLGKTENRRFLALSLGFSAGVMIYVSLVEMFFTAKANLTEALGQRPGYIATVAAFFLGLLIIGIIDKLIPSEENPHEFHSDDAMDDSFARHRFEKLHRTGILVALAIAIHNFPEGLATFMAAIKSPALGVAVAFAIAIHNIPEGISISVPIYYATGNKMKAFVYSFLSGITEPLGALIGYAILRPFMNQAVLGITFAAVAGIMVFISIDELMPAAQKYGEHHLSIYGFVGGMAVMAVSLIMLS